jgi:hypothetical protein
MSKQTSILWSESVGAFSFSAFTAVVTYFYAQNSFFSSSGWGAITIGSNSFISVLFASILSAWVGMIIGGIIGINTLKEKPKGDFFAGGFGLFYGVCAFFVLFISFKLHEEVSSSFIAVIFIALSVSSILSGVFIYRSTNIVDKDLGELPKLLISFILPLMTALGIIMSQNTRTSNQPSNFSFGGTIGGILFYAVLTLPPMLILWAVFSAIYNSTSIKKEEV